MSRRGITCEVAETASGPGHGTGGDGHCTRYVAIHPLRGDTPDQNGCNAYGSGAPHNTRIPQRRVCRPAGIARRQEHTKPHEPPVWRAPEGPANQAAAPVGGGGAWPGFEPTHKHTSAHQAPPVWRAPEGPEGTGGLRGAAPNEVRPPSLAGGRALRRPEHQRSHKQQHATRTASGRATAHRHTQRPGPPAPETPVGPQAARPASTTQQNEAATGCPATASSRSRSAVHNSATSNQAVMST